MGGIYVDFSVVNQLNSPALNSNTFANRPSAGQAGRLFVSTDTFEIYRDNGTSWDLIGGPGSSTVIGSGTATQVAFWNASQQITGSNNLWFDNTNSFLGIGNNTPAGRLGITGTDIKGIDTSINTVSGTGSTSIGIYAKNTTNASGFAAVFEESTPNVAGSQFPVQIINSLSSGTAANGMNTGMWYSLPDDTGALKTSLHRITSINTAAANYSTRQTLEIWDNNTRKQFFNIDPTGVGINILSPSGLLHADGGANVARMILDADNNVARIFSFRTDNLQRWAFRVDGNETGGDTGANFTIRRYDDTGTFIDAPLHITRSSGNVGIQVTPNAWNTTNRWALQIASASLAVTKFNDDYLSLNANTFLNNAGNYIRINNGFATRYEQVGGDHQWLAVGTGNAGDVLTFGIPKMTLKSNGDLGVGTATVQARLQVTGGFTAFDYNNPSGYPIFNAYRGAISSNFSNGNNELNIWNTVSGGFSFHRQTGVGAQTTLLNITNGGNVLIGSNTDNGNRLQVTGQATISGNVGIGVTPSAWSAGSAIDIASWASFGQNSGNGYTLVGGNTYFDGTNYRYKNSAAAALYQIDGPSGRHFWSVAGSGTAGNAITFTQAMTLDASGRLLLNNTTNYYNYQFQTRGQGYFYSTANDTGLVINPNGTFTNIQGVVPSSGNVENITLQASGGNVLIGTQTDNGRLFQVNGGGIFTGTGYDTTNSAEIELNNTTPTTGKKFVLNSSNNGDFQIADKTAGGATRFVVNSSGNTIIYGSVKTDAPTGGTAQPWKLGTVATVSPTSPNRTIEVEINGTTYYIHAKTTNN